MLIIELTQLIKKLHSIGFVHNDIKTDNILIGSRDPSRIVLIDYGLCTPYLNANGDHIAEGRMGLFNGNLMFSSHNSCKGLKTSRRDDMISLVNMMVYLLDNDLPWYDKLTKNFNSQKVLKIRASKSMLEKLAQRVPDNLKVEAKRIYQLKFDECPDYDGFIDALMKENLEHVEHLLNGQPIRHFYEWARPLSKGKYRDMVQDDSLASLEDCEVFYRNKRSMSDLSNLINASAHGLTIKSRCSSQFAPSRDGSSVSRMFRQHSPNRSLVPSEVNLTSQSSLKRGESFSEIIKRSKRLKQIKKEPD